MTTLRTDKAVWPSVLEEQGSALLFCSVQLLKLLQTEAFLELNFVFRHDNSSFKKPLFRRIMP